MLRPSLGFRMRCGAHLQLRLDLLPKGRVYDAEFRDRLYGPIVGGVGTDPHIPADRLDDLACSVVDELAGIKPVAQHAVATLSAA